jgi:hypothetical protein
VFEELMMSGRIRYAWGSSPYGDFLVAMAGSDMAVFEFPPIGSEATTILKARFPNALIEEDATGLESTIADCARFVDHPERCPLDRTISRHES